MRFFDRFFSQISYFFRKPIQPSINDEELKTLCFAGYEFTILDFVIGVAVNLTANILANAEFCTYDKGERIKKKNYYTLNIAPNQNESGQAFWKRVILKLLYDNECLVVTYNDQLYLADSFDTIQFALKPNLYKNVKIADNFTFTERTFTESEVFHFCLDNPSIQSLMSGVARLYSKLLELSYGVYQRNNAQRAVLHIPATYPVTERAQKSLQSLIESQLQAFFNNENGAVLPLTNGLTLDYLTNSSYKNASDSGDIRNIITDIYLYVSNAFCIPLALLRGQVADTQNSMDNFYLMTLRPIARILESELNRKVYAKAYTRGNYIKVDISSVRLHSLSDMAGAVDILTRNATNTIDDNLELLGRERLNNRWSNQRFITKNYETLENFTKQQCIDSEGVDE